MQAAAKYPGTRDVLITFIATATIALAGLVIEDALPRETDGKRVEFHFEPWRVRLFLLATFLLLLLVLIRATLSRRQGTLYYVRLLDEWMSDRHLDTVRGIANGYRDERTVTEHMHAAPRAGVVDVADQLTSVSQRLEATMNEDEVGTGYHLAPNMIWPSALALGYHLNPRPSMTLLEMPPPKKSKDKISLDDILEWPLFGATSTSPRFTAPEVRMATTSGTAPARHVLVSVELTGQGPVAPPRDWTPDVKLRVAVYQEPGGDVDAEYCKVHIDVDPTAEVQADERLVHPQAAVETVTCALRYALSAHQGATVYAALRVPKSVAVAIGFRLSGGCPDDAQCAMKRSDTKTPRPADAADTKCITLDFGGQERHPWRRLVLLQRDQEVVWQAPIEYQVLRVHPGQPCVEGLVAAARRDGLRLSGMAPLADASHDQAGGHT